MKNKPFSKFSDRKKDHINLSLKKSNRAKGKSGFDRIRLKHSALPEIDFSEVDISTQIFGQPILTPFVVTGMTGGWEGAKAINTCIAKVAEKRGWVMGAGSQRRQRTDPSAQKEWHEIRKFYPRLILIGNIGLSQLIKTPVSQVEELVLSLKAQAMAIHTNPLQEGLQIEGTPQFKGGLKALKNLCAKLSVPVILKETGSGFSKQTLKTLLGIGLNAVDVSGLGGTHFGRVEGDRVPKDHYLYGTAHAFRNWGIPTVEALLSAQQLKPDYKVWASGGIRNGCDSAKALALGASQVGFARPVMEQALKGEKALDQFMARTEYELKLALFCSGCKTNKEIQSADKWELL